MNRGPHARAEIRDGALHFESDEGWADALARGVFYLRAPEGLDYAAGERFCRAYHLPRTGGADDAYRGFREAKLEGSVLGYSSAGNDQVERVQLEIGLWERHLPAELPPLLHALNRVARTIVRAFFARCGVREADIARITGGMDHDLALQYCIFNNYASSSAADVGFTPHKDSGFITIMCSTEPGLEALEDGAWVNVDPLPGYLTVLHGDSIEVLTARLATPAAATYHRVRHQERARQAPDRVSFGVYIGPRFEQDLYQYDAEGRLRPLQSFLSFQRNKAVEMGYEFHPAVDAASPAPAPAEPPAT